MFAGDARCCSPGRDGFLYLRMRCIAVCLGLAFFSGLACRGRVCCRPAWFDGTARAFQSAPMGRIHPRSLPHSLGGGRKGRGYIDADQAGECVFSQSFRAESIRVCQPSPVDRNVSTTSRERRIVILSGYPNFVIDSVDGYAVTIYD